VFYFFDSKCESSDVWLSEGEEYDSRMHVNWHVAKALSVKDLEAGNAIWGDGW